MLLRNARPLRARLLGVLTLSLILAGCGTTVRQHPEFLTRIKTVSSIGVMPARAEVTRIVFKGDNERLHHEEDDIERRLPGVLVQGFRELDLLASEVDLADPVLASDPDLVFETSLALDGHAEAMDETYESFKLSKSEAESYERSLGSEVTRFAEMADVDALAFARYRGFRLSEGETARVLALSLLSGGVAATEGARVEVAIVDGHSGDILWCNAVRYPDPDASLYQQSKGVPELEVMVRKVLKGFDRSAPRIRSRNKPSKQEAGR